MDAHGSGMRAGWHDALARLRRAASPASRLRHARVLHGVRVAAAMLATIALTSGIDIPHGIWASISMLVVIGGLQHQGNIRQKAIERGAGTILGALIGLAWVAQYAWLGSVWLTYLLLAVSAGICAYHAIGKGGYIALLTAITMCIVAGHGDDPLEVGLWRTANVLIGIAIALLFSFVLPMRASDAWRGALALNLRLCAQVLNGPAAAPAAFDTLNQRLVSLRTLMPWVARETGMAPAELESVQREHRALIGTLELLSANPTPADDVDGKAAARRIRAMLLATARALRASGAPDGLKAVPAVLPSGHWLLDQIALHAERIAAMLAASPTARR